jgi:hypothetical protein
MQEVQASSAFPIIKIAGNACAAALFVIREDNARCARAFIASRARPLKKRCVDSESGLLAMKKFSCLTRSGLASALQSGSLLRITTVDSQHAHS